MIWKIFKRKNQKEGGLPPHLITGEIGERAAARHLWRAGYRILARNFHGAGGEIDIVAEKRRVIYFVEVKTRGGEAGPEAALAAVDEEKRRRIRQAARAYMRHFDGEDIEARFAVVTVEIEDKGKVKAVTLFEGE